MPKQPPPPRDSSGQFIKKSTSKQPPSDSKSLSNPKPKSKLKSMPTEPKSARESKDPTSRSTPPDSSITSPSPKFAVTPQSTLVRHSIPGSFSPLSDSPSESPIPVSTSVTRNTRLLISPSSVPDLDFSNPSLISLPESVVSLNSSSSFGPLAPEPDPVPDADFDSVSSPASSSSDSSKTVSFEPRAPSPDLTVNFRASQFLLSRLDFQPVSASTSTSTSSASSSSAVSSVPSQFLVSSQNQLQQSSQYLPHSSTFLSSSTLVPTPVAPILPPTVPTPSVPTPPLIVHTKVSTLQAPAPPPAALAPPQNIPAPPPP
ncbi:hypothetical protein V8E53_008873, partial [Lactarius tabidus]